MSKFITVLILLPLLLSGCKSKEEVNNFWENFCESRGGIATRYYAPQVTVFSCVDGSHTHFGAH